MVRKDREKAKRLFSPAVKEQGFKMARTEESEGEVDETKQDPLLSDLYDNMEIPTTPSRTEREMASIDMMVDSPLTLREEGEIGKGEDPVMEGNVEHSKQESALVKGGETPAEKAVRSEEEADWRIPEHYKLDWVSARVELLMISMDVIGGMYTPVFVAVDPSPSKQEEVGPEMKSPAREVSSLF